MLGLGRNRIAAFLALVVGNALNSLSGSTITMAAITDVCKGDQALMAETLAKFTGYVGIGVVLGPQIGYQVMISFLSPPTLTRAYVVKFCGWGVEVDYVEASGPRTGQGIATPRCVHLLGESLPIPCR